MLYISKMFFFVGRMKIVLGGYFVRLILVKVMLMMMKIVSIVICEVGLMRIGGFVDCGFFLKIFVI